MRFSPDQTQSAAVSVPDNTERELKGCKERYFSLVAMQLLHV